MILKGCWISLALEQSTLKLMFAGLHFSYFEMQFLGIIKAFINCRYKSRIRGQFSAITYPTPVGPIITQGRYQENLFLSMYDYITKTYLIT